MCMDLIILPYTTAGAVLYSLYSLQLLRLEPIHCTVCVWVFILHYLFIFTMCAALHQHLAIVLNTGFATQFASWCTNSSGHARIRDTKSTVPSTIIGLGVLTSLNCTIHARITKRIIGPSMAYTIIYVFNRGTNTTFILPLSKDRGRKPGLRICIGNY